MDLSAAPPLTALAGVLPADGPAAPTDHPTASSSRVASSGSATEDVLGEAVSAHAAYMSAVPEARHAYAYGGAGDRSRSGDGDGYESARSAGTASSVSAYRLPDVLAVAIRDPVTSEVEREVFVAIERPGGDDGRKPYLGGYRDARTGLAYHHAYSQTPSDSPRVPKWANAPPKFTRETQTATLVARSTQSYREGAAQTLRHDIHTDTSTDRVLAPRKYFTADELNLVRAAKALMIACHWRGYTARKRAAALRAARAAAQSAVVAEERRAAAEAEAKARRDMERRLHPRSLEDFAVLFDEVEAWRVAETARIGAEHAADERARKEALAELLAKETALIGTIERLRTVANKENREKRIEAVFAAMASPQVWPASDGEATAVYTPLTTRAAELRALYQALAAPGASTDDRIDVVLRVKYTAKEYDTALTREIVELADREVDMVRRGRPAATLDGLRKRLRNLFLTFCETPEYNPQAAAYAKPAPAARDPRTLPTLLRPGPPTKY
jgi:hypothetical protein